MKFTRFTLMIPSSLLVVIASFAAQAQPGDKGSPAQSAAQIAPGSTGFVAKIEARMGRQLTTPERSALAQASQRHMQELRSIQSTFTLEIARISGLPAGDIEAMLPKIGQSNAGFDKNMIPKIEARLNRKLTPAEMQQIRAADEKKKSAMQPLRDRFAADVAKITGLAASEITGMLPKIGL